MVDEVAKPPLQSADGEASPDATLTASGADIASAAQQPASQLKQPAVDYGPQAIRKRMRRFMRLVPRVLSGEGAEAVHDLRVWSRRLQQGLAVYFGKPMPRPVRSLYQALRRARRAVGEWRNHDVVLEALGRKRNLSRSTSRRQAWDLVIELVERERIDESRRARKRLLKLELFDRAQKVEDQLYEAGHHQSRHSAHSRSDEKMPSQQRAPESLNREALVEAATRWLTALGQARKTAAESDVHALRIQTKRLRYRVELADELEPDRTAIGEQRPQPGERAASLPTYREALKALKGAQEALGDWHDHCELSRAIARAVSQEEVLLGQPRIAIVLVKELARLQEAIQEELRRMLHPGEKSSLASLHQWVEAFLAHSDEQASPHAGGIPPAPGEMPR